MEKTNIVLESLKEPSINLANNDDKARVNSLGLLFKKLVWQNLTQILKIIKIELFMFKN